MLTSIKKNVLKILLLLFIVIATINIKAFAIVKQTNEFYVNDYANILDTDTENYIINANKQLYNQTGAQIVVVTVPNLEGKPLEEYATELFRNFGIGDKNKNNGVLLLLALEERQFRVEVGYGLEGVLPDGKTGRIQDEYIIPYLKQNNWNEGIKNGFSAILEIVSKEYGAEVDLQNPVATGYDEDLEGFQFAGIPIISYIAGAMMKFSKKGTNKLFYIIYILAIGAIYLIFNLAGSLGATIVMIIINIIVFLTGRFRNPFTWRILQRRRK